MAKTTLTQAQALVSAITLINGGSVDIPTEDIVAKLSAMHDTIANKSHSVSKADVAMRSALSDIIITTLAECNAPITVSELQRLNPALATTEKGEIISGQRVTSILHALVKSGKVENTKDKKKSLFSLVRD